MNDNCNQLFPAYALIIDISRLDQGTLLLTKFSASSTSNLRLHSTMNSTSSRSITGQEETVLSHLKSRTTETVNPRHTLASWVPTIGLRTISALSVGLPYFDQVFIQYAVLKQLLAFLTPANAMLSVELSNLADILDAAGQASNISEQAREWSSRIHDAIWNTTVSSISSKKEGLTPDIADC
jgi:hypothetical protein